MKILKAQSLCEHGKNKYCICYTKPNNYELNKDFIEVNKS